MEKSKDVVVTEKGSHLSNGVHLCNGNNKPGMTAETIVQIHSQVSRGCYFTRFQVICAVFAFLLTIAVAIVLVAFVKKENNIYVTRPSPVCSCDKSNGYNVTFAFTKDSKNVTVLYAENLTQVENKSASNVSSGEESVVSEKPKVQKDQPIVTQPYREIRLPRSLIPSFYDIELKIDLENDTFFGRVNMTLKAMNRTKFVIFHINMLRISRESIFVRNVKTREFIGIRKQFRVWSNQFYVLELVKEVTVGETYIVEVNSFLGFINKDLKGLYLSTYTTPEGETRKLAATQLQSTDARKMFPCLDEPDMKARFAVTIIHQDKYTALSNMPPMTEQFIPPIWLKVKYHVTPIMSTYLLAIIVSDFKYQERNLTGDYRLKVWAQPNKINQTDYAMDMAEKCYLFFLDYFNISDVVPKSDHVAVPDFSGGAMENWGLVIYRETALLYDPDVSSGENQLMVTLIVAHEVAHTWFGNMVTMKWWDDLWLNEGFASLLMYFAMDHIFPEWNVFTLHVVVREVFQVMVNDALLTSHPVSAPIIHPDDIAEYFDMISYSKLYVRKYKFQNAEMEDLWETFSEAVNYEIDVKSIMNTWTKQMGYPVVTMRTEGDYYLLEQERFLLDANSSSANDSIYGYKWRIPFTYIVESNPGVESKSLVWLNMTSGEASTKYTDFVLRARRLSDKLLSQGYVCDRLTSSLKKFYGRYGELVIHYDVPLSRMVDDILS
ncbi:hypothetical protein FSP39_018048 [Pinctada imbricata]|uniref:Aminopeptidase n=1 Tax=Pinctada imbricata TaxID=66713 RepID=A0AA88Y159_PINIB|nr:hypothetical protein FSP39_018048 [Pinctada imbricata]